MKGRGYVDYFCQLCQGWDVEGRVSDWTDSQTGFKSS